MLGNSRYLSWGWVYEIWSCPLKMHKQGEGVWSHSPCTPTPSGTPGSLLVGTHDITARWQRSEGIRAPFNTFPVATGLAMGLCAHVL